MIGREFVDIGGMASRTSRELRIPGLRRVHPCYGLVHWGIGVRTIVLVAGRLSGSSREMKMERQESRSNNSFKVEVQASGEVS